MWVQTIHTFAVCIFGSLYVHHMHFGSPVGAMFTGNEGVDGVLVDWADTSAGAVVVEGV